MRLARASLPILAVLAVTSPGGAAGSKNLVVNGDFEEPRVDAGGVGFQASIPGWTKTKGSIVEVQAGAAGKSRKGRQHVELDGHNDPSSTTLSQTLTTETDKTYAIRVAFSPRPGVGDNALEIKWNGERVATLRESGIGLAETRWTYFTFCRRAVSTSTTLELGDVSAPDTVGTYVDDVSVVLDAKCATQLPNP